MKFNISSEIFLILYFDNSTLDSLDIAFVLEPINNFINRCNFPQWEKNVICNMDF